LDQAFSDDPVSDRSAFNGRPELRDGPEIFRPDDAGLSPVCTYSPSTIGGFQDEEFAMGKKKLLIGIQKLEMIKMMDILHRGHKSLLLAQGSKKVPMGRPGQPGQQTYVESADS
jgi:hypothetical protein